MNNKVGHKIPSINLKSFLTLATVILFGILTIWWIVLFFIKSEYQNVIWLASYQIVALWGGVLGLFVIGRLWGGLRSIAGRAVTCFSLGLLMQVLGQSVYDFYTIFLRVGIPYPSLADLGFFGSIPFYIYGIILLGRTSGIRFSLKSFGNRVWAVLIPVTILLFSYLSFLWDYQVDLSDRIRIFLDFAYPMSEAIYVSIAIVVYVLSRNILGGVMRNKILLFLGALVMQYIAEYNFLYQALKETWTNGGYGDYIYLCAYFLMSLALVRLLDIFEQKSGDISMNS